MPLTVALIIEHFDATRGSAERLAVWLAGELAGAGLTVHVVCHDVASRISRYRAATARASHDADRSHQAYTSEQAIPAGVHIHTLRGMKLNTAMGLRRFGHRARRWCRQHPLDVVHSLTVACPGDLYHPHAGLYDRIHSQAVASRESVAAARFKRLMLSLSPRQQTLLALERRALSAPPRGAAKILGISAMMTRHFQEVYGVAEQRVVLLPNPRLLALPDPVKAAQYRALFRAHYRLADTDRVALFVGHDFRRKGLRFAIEAVEATRDWKLLVVGLGRVRAFVEYVEEAHLTDRIKFVGPTRQMEQVYAAGDALILPTFYDPFGVVAVEALAHGLPVVSTAFLGAADLVRQSNVGTIVPSPRDVPALTAALEALASGVGARTALAARARGAAEGMPPEAYIRRIIALYESIVAEKRSAR